MSRRSATSVTRSSKVVRLRDSLGFRIPQEAAARLNLRAGDLVSVEIHADRLTIRPVRAARKRWSEAELLRGVTPKIIGGEVDWGKPVGTERA